jgi:transcriptional regulator with XRE-family HTH domain
MSRKKTTPTGSEVSGRVRALRKALKLNQEDFAARMGVGRVAALYWESGRSQPSVEVLIRMAKVAREVNLESAVWFWHQIGVDREALKDLLPELRKSSDEVEQRVRIASEKSAKGIVTLPILCDVWGLKEPMLITSEQIGGWLPLPDALIPNPSRTSCVHAPKGMTTLFGDDLIVVDATPHPIEKLWGKIVIAESRSSKITYVGFLQRFKSDGRYIPTLSQARLNEDLYLNSNGEPNSEVRLRNQKRPAVGHVLHLPGRLLSLSPISDWDLIGYAVCWIGCEDQGGLARLDHD